MKPSHRRTHHHHHHYSSPYFKKYYRWILWVSLSLYLFFFFSSSPSFFLFPTPPVSFPASFLGRTTTTQNYKTNPRALLIEKEDISNNLLLQNRTSGTVKIYIYDLPSHYNRDWLANERCGSHLFAAEVAIHEALLSSPARVSDPDEADFFFVPVYVSCNFSTVNGFPSLSHARSLLFSAVDRVSTRYPFWNRTGGRDHVVVASHDYGACFHAMEDVAITDGIPEFLKNSVLLQTFGVWSPHRCQEAEHVIIPPYIPPEVVEWAPHPEIAERDIWVFFRGKMEVRPKNIGGRFYSRKVRTEIWNRFNGNRRFYLRRKRFEGYRSEIGRSVFCLCPLGWAPWSPRLVESVLLGCVPVIIADEIRLPFPDAVDWPSISLTVAENEVRRLEEILGHVEATNLTAIQHNLWDPMVRQALVFNHRMRDGDATWQVMRALEGKLNRSWRRRDGHVSG